MCAGSCVTGMGLTLLLSPLAGCGLVAPDCETEVIAEAVSPDKRTKVTAFERGCGATSRRNTRVAMYPATDPLEAGERVLSTDGRYDVKISWVNPTSLRLELSCPSNCDPRIKLPHVRKRRIGEISVEYQYSDALVKAIGAEQR